jgi:hypothetical protein
VYEFNSQRARTKSLALLKGPIRAAITLAAQSGQLYQDKGAVASLGFYKPHMAQPKVDCQKY